MAKKIVMVNLPPAESHSYSTSRAYPATGILIVGTVLKASGFDVKVIDGALFEDYAARTLAAISGETVMVGFSVMTSQVPMALKLSGLIKKIHPDLTVAWGGIHAILFPEQTVTHPDVDLVVTGEGHRTVLDLVEHFNGERKLTDVRGIARKDSNGVAAFTEKAPADNIEELPHIDFTILDDNESYLAGGSVFARELRTGTKEPLRIMPIITALGCCYKCRFCINVILKRGYRYRSAASIIDEVKRLKRLYNANAFVFFDEDFFISKKRLAEFVDLIESEGLQFYWRTWGRVNYFKESYVDREMVLRLEKNGLRSIAMGAESGSQKILDSIEKGIKVADVLRSAATLCGTKVTARYSFIVGLEGEEMDDTIATYRLCAELMDTNPDVDIAGPFIFRYYPGSPIFERITSRYGIHVPERLEDWEGALHKEGFLEIDEMPWVWDGCIDAVRVLNNAVNVHNKLRGRDNILVRAMRRFVRWRLKAFNSSLPLDIYLTEVTKKTYSGYLGLRRVLAG